MATKTMKAPIKKIASDTSYSKLPEGGWKTTITDKFARVGSGNGATKKSVSAGMGAGIKKPAMKMEKSRTEMNPGVPMLKVPAKGIAMAPKMNMSKPNLITMPVPTPKPAANKVPVKRSQDTFQKDPIGVTRGIIGDALKGKSAFVGKNPQGKNVYASRTSSSPRGGNMKSIKKR